MRTEANFGLDIDVFVGHFSQLVDQTALAIVWGHSKVELLRVEYVNRFGKPSFRITIDMGLGTPATKTYVPFDDDGYDRVRRWLKTTWAQIEGHASESSTLGSALVYQRLSDSRNMIAVETEEEA